MLKLSVQPRQRLFLLIFTFSVIANEVKQSRFMVWIASSHLLAMMTKQNWMAKHFSMLSIKKSQRLLAFSCISN